MLKTASITFICGLGHIGSSVLLGLIGITFGIAISELGGLESLRGNLAGWAMIGFGLVSSVWGIRHAIKNKPHSHLHHHSDDETYSHSHIHAGDHTHAHDDEKSSSLTPWILFTIFIFGPCEPLIPVLMYPAAKGSTIGLISVTLVFGATTIATMLGIVLLASYGSSLVPTRKLDRYAHALAGGTILLCGVGMQFLGI